MTGYVFTRRRIRGFTLIELMVVVAILAVIGGLLLPAVSQAKQKAHYINEINTAKQLMVAYKMYADDNAGYLLPGYRYGYTAEDRAGKSIEHPINARYPWRIAPYLGGSFEIMYANRNRSLLHSFDDGNEDNYAYAASVFPSMGINSVFMGGDDLILPPSPKAFRKFGRFCVVRESELSRPSQLLTFVSSRGKFEGKVVDGFYRVEPPYLTKRSWSESWDASLAPELFGFVHPRFNEQAVANFMDGHARGLQLDELQDMRYWANPANRPDWVLSPR